MSNTNTQEVKAEAALLSELKAQYLAAEAQSRTLMVSGKAAGPKTGFTRLDNELNGFLAVGFHSLLAAPGCGKTAFTLQIATQCGCPCLYVTAEMEPLDLMRRVIAQTSSTFVSKLSGGTLSEAELCERLERMEAAAPMVSILDSTSAPVGAYEIIEAAEALKVRFNSEHVLVIVDSVTDWGNAVASIGGNQSTEYQITESALTALKAVAAHLKCPVIGIGHKNRSSKDRGGEEGLFAAKGSGRWEYISHTLWSLDEPTDTKTNPDAVLKPLVLTLAKNRQGTKGAKINFQFEGRLMQFREGAFI